MPTNHQVSLRRPTVSFRAVLSRDLHLLPHPKVIESMREYAARCMAREPLFVDKTKIVEESICWLVKVRIEWERDGDGDCSRGC